MIAPKLAAAACMLLLTAGAAFAAERVPLTGDPALVIDPPSGWSADRDAQSGGSLVIGAPDKSGAIVLAVAPLGAAAGQSTDDMAAAVAAGLGAGPVTASGAASISGHAGKFYEFDLAKQGMAVHIHLTMILVGGYVASDMQMLNTQATPAQAQSLKAVDGLVRFDSAH